MKEKKRKKFIPIWLIVIGILIIGVVALIETFISSSTGIRFSFENYEGTSKVIAFFIAITAIILAIKRMQQTEEQTDVMTDNIKFNNFHKHRKLFYDHMSQTKVMRRVIDYSESKSEHIIPLYYNCYFYESYEKFVPKINNFEFEKIKEFSAKLKSSQFNMPVLSEEKELYLSDLWKDIIKDIPYVFLGNAIDHIFEANSDWQKEKGGEGELEKNVMTNILSAYYSYFIIQEILIFVGKDIKILYCPDFIENVKTICKQRRLEHVLVN